MSWIDHDSLFAIGQYSLRDDSDAQVPWSDTYSRYTGMEVSPHGRCRSWNPDIETHRMDKHGSWDPCGGSCLWEVHQFESRMAPVLVPPIKVLTHLWTCAAVMQYASLVFA